jgi:amino acid permease
MDNIESIDESFSSSELKVNTQSLEHLRLTARWSQFLSILGFIGLGFMLLGVFGLMAMKSQMSYSRFGGSRMDTSVIMIVYLVMIVVYFFPIYYLYQFSAKMKKALDQKDTITFAEATGFLKNHFQFVGICAIIVVSLYILAFVVGIGAAIM